MSGSLSLIAPNKLIDLRLASYLFNLLCVSLYGYEAKKTNSPFTNVPPNTNWGAADNISRSARCPTAMAPVCVIPAIRAGFADTLSEASTTFSVV